MYLNTLFLGNGAYGVGAAAMKYFSKSVKDLELHEIALIAGLFQSPSRLNPVNNKKLARGRQKQVLKAMRIAGYLNQDQYDTELKKKVRYRFYSPTTSPFAPYFVDFIKEKSQEFLKSKQLDSSGLRIYTTLDPQLQAYANQTYRQLESSFKETERHTTKTGKSRQLESSMVITNPTTGEVLAMIGGRDYKVSEYNRAVSSRRSPGSAFKPVVFSTALMNQWKWNDVIYVAPINIDNYKPKNHGSDFLTEATLIRAFYKSLNSPTIELAQKVGLAKILEQAKNLGIQSPIKNEFGSALGSSDVSLFDLSRMYGTFANSGQRVELSAISKITDLQGNVLYEAPKVEKRTVRVISEPIAFLMTEGMRDVFRFGTASSSHDFGDFAAGKTGTSNDSTDNWFCGYTKDLVGIVWVGTDDHTPIYGNQTGGSLALPVWDLFMKKVYGSSNPKTFTEPSGIAWHEIDAQNGYISDDGIRVPFLISNQPKPSQTGAKSLNRSSSQGSFRNVFAK